MYLRQGLLQHHHGEDRRAGGNVAGAHGHRIGGSHAGTRVALRRADGAAGLERAGGIQELGALGSQAAGRRTGRQHLGENVLELPGEAVVGDVRVIACNLLRVKVHGLTVDGEHARGVAHAQHLLAGELPVNIPGQGGEIGNVLHMGLAVQDGLVEMGHRPALGHIKVEKLGKLRCGRAGGGVAPCTEGHQELTILVKGQVAVHHGREAHAAHLGERLAVFFLHIRGQVCIGIP